MPNKLYCGTSPRQGPLDPPLRSKPPIHDPTRQNHVLSNPWELLVGIESKMSRSTVHPKPPTTRLQTLSSKLSKSHQKQYKPGRSLCTSYEIFLFLYHKRYKEFNKNNSFYHPSFNLKNCKVLYMNYLCPNKDLHIKIRQKKNI